MNKFIGIFIFLWLALFYKYIEEVRISKERHAQVQELTSKLFQLEQKNIIDNQIIANNELTKRNLENQSLQMQEKLDDLLKNNNCANEHVPDDIANRLYERAKGIRQSTDIRKSVN